MIRGRGGGEREVTVVMGPVSTSSLTPYTATALSDLGSVVKKKKKIPAPQTQTRPHSQGLAGSLSELLPVQTNRTVQQQDGGWLVRNGTGDFNTSWLSA